MSDDTVMQRTAASVTRSISTNSQAPNRRSTVDRQQVAKIAKKRLDSHAVLSNRERLETLQEIDEIDRQQEFFVEKLETPKTTSRKFDGKFWGDKHLNSGVTQEDLATWYDRTDKRSDVDKLTDYMSILAAPSQAELNGDMGPLSATDAYHKSWTTVYEEGFGGSRGCTKEYWRQRFVEENHGPQKLKLWRTPDNQVFHSLQLRTREFFDLGGYRAFPDIVTVEVIFRELFDINATRGTFRVAFILSLRWYDSHFDCANYANQRGEQVFARSIPYVTIDGADAGENAMGVPEDAGSVSAEEKHSGMVTLCKGGDPPGVLYKSMRVSATFRDDSDLSWFPFDMQALSIGFRLWGSNVPDDFDEGRILVPLNIVMELQHAHPEWLALSANVVSSEPRHDRQKMTVTLNLRRRPMYFIFNVMVVIGILTTMCFGVFRQTTAADDYEARCQTTLTLMLSSIAYKFFVADMVPKVSYLTVLDIYIYAGLLTCAFIFALNTVTICYDHGGNDCEDEDRIERFGWMALVALWSCANIFAFAAAAWYVYVVYHRDRHLRVYSENQPKMKEAKDGRLRELMYKAKSSERFYPKGATTVALRRYNACQNLREIELRQFWLMLECGGDLSKWMAHPQRLPNASPRLLKLRGCKMARERKHQLTRVDLDGDSGVPELLRRAGLEDNLAVLGPLLVGAGLTEVRLAAVYNNGQGSAALNALLENAGVVEPVSRVQIIAALEPETEITSRLLKQLEEDHAKEMFLVLQGSGTYLWQFLGAPDRPILRNTFLDMIDDALATRCAEAESADVSVMNVRNIANCIVAKLILTSPMLGRAKFVYSRRQITKPRIFYTQIWAGYLRSREGTVWDKSKGDAIAVEIGAAKMAYMAVGCAGSPRTALGSDELDYRTNPKAQAMALNDEAKQTLARLYTKSVVFAHPYLTNIAGKDDHRGLDAHLREMKINLDEELQHERFGRSQTDRMRDLCTRILEDWVFPVLADEKNIKYVLLFGTAQLRREIADLEMLCGALASQHLSEIASFCTEMMFQAGHDVKVTFELLDPFDQAECHSIAVQEGLGNMDIKDTQDPDLVRRLQMTLLDDPTHNTFGCATVGMREILGTTGGEKFVVPVGLEHAITGLLDLSRIQKEAMIPPGHKHSVTGQNDLRANLRRSTLEPSRFTSTQSCGPPVLDGPQSYSNLEEAIETVTRDLAKMLQNLSSQIRPFHPAVSGAHSAKILRRRAESLATATASPSKVNFGFKGDESSTEEPSSSAQQTQDGNDSDDY